MTGFAHLSFSTDIHLLYVRDGFQQLKGQSSTAESHFLSADYPDILLVVYRDAAKLLDVCAGQRVCEGENLGAGAGKSATVKKMAGILVPRSTENYFN